MALITAVLITALVSLTAVNMAARQTLDLRRTANVIDGGRAYAFALGVESWVRQVLLRDKKSSTTDHLGEDWAVQLPPLEVEGATVGGRLEDMQGRFNINNLLGEDGGPSALDVQRFRRLLDHFNAPKELSDAVVDWLDGDSDTHFPGGAEDGDYLHRQPPYRAANQTMVSPSELLLIKGFDREIYRQLAPFICALPTRTAINVNTAPAEVLMALADNVSREDAEMLIAEREESGFSSVEAFVQHDALAGRGVNEDGLSVSSDYFLMDARTTFGRARAHLYSLLRRTEEGTDVLWRARGAY